MNKYIINTEAKKFLYDLFIALKKEAENRYRKKTERDKLDELAKRFFENKYPLIQGKDNPKENEEFDFGGGGIGIIHTIIDLGEKEKNKI